MNQRFLQDQELKVQLLGRGFAWLDTGTHDSLSEASTFVEVIEKRQGLKLACLEGIALRQGWITPEKMRELAQPMIKNQYGQYLLKLAAEFSGKEKIIKIVWTLLRNLLSLLKNRIYKDIMAQLIVTVDDLELLPDLKRAIKMLRGVKDITVQTTVDIPNKATQRAIKELKEGKTIKCRSFEEYLAKVK